MYLAVFLHGTETGVIPEVVLFRMFQDKPTSRFQDVPVEHHAGELVKIRQIIGRVGEYNIERVGEGVTEKRKNIALKCFHLPEVKLAQGIPDKAYVPVVHLHQGDLRGAA